MKAQTYIITLVMVLGLNHNILAATARQQGYTPQYSSTSHELSHNAQLNSQIKGIYISQATLEDREYLEYLIARSKEVGINTFIIDLNRVSNKYEKNILLVKNAGFKYVARIVVFPLGLDNYKMKSEAYLMSRYRLVEAALTLGANEIQLDYIRSENSQDLFQVISWFKDKIDNRAMLKVDVFGESSFKESSHLEQNLVVFASSVDANPDICYAWNATNKYDHLFSLMAKH